jgi:hypothetical protein
MAQLSESRESVLSLQESEESAGAGVGDVLNSWDKVDFNRAFSESVCVLDTFYWKRAIA